MRVAAVQMRSGIDRASNLEAAEALIRKAASEGASFIATPEMTTLVDQNRKRILASVAEPSPDEESALCALSQELGVTLSIGSMPVMGEKEGMLRNRQLLVSEGRVVATYDKVHLFDVDLDTGESWKESSLYEPGEEAVVADLGGVKLGLTVCFDLRFPKLYRQLAEAGAQVFTVPAAFTVPTGKAHWLTLLKARAIETGSFVIAPAQGGEHEDGRRTYGHSAIISPWGEVLDELQHDEPGIAYADIDFAKVADMRSRIPTLDLARDAKLRIYKA
ncbi:carbon-nitrogen hydrolase family protein [Parvularcula sp. ZS-1/3]|uniref:Carbon-nitrogen hydrolase family protein n=1 Tax=Parvularcula mediterranea TaxID=2732508 RepID=A0A7Y3RN68_9PROT|nr:carbon-nitrogen hydrolase family protein [Parvularcula mediterranea]NNU16362.1 carbon-nitrogen hydrolase family protein [Parvularcula mediterranea]